jgi:DNA-binding NarL/FixJ family response regulator
MVMEAIMQPTKLESTRLEEKALGFVWIDCPYPMLALGLEKALSAEAWVHRQRKAPTEDSPSIVIYCPNSRKDVASRVNAIQTLFPGTVTLLFGLNVDLQLARTALKEGARGFIHAGMSPKQIIQAVLVASEGETVVPRELLNDLVAGTPSPELLALSPRQREIFELVAEGLTNAQIARRLFLSESTIKQHLRLAYKLLGIKNRTQAAQLLRQSNLA